MYFPILEFVWEKCENQLQPMKVHYLLLSHNFQKKNSKSYFISYSTKQTLLNNKVIFVQFLIKAMTMKGSKKNIPFFQLKINFSSTYFPEAIVPFTLGVVSTNMDQKGSTGFSLVYTQTPCQWKKSYKFLIKAIITIEWKTEIKIPKHNVNPELFK